MLLKVEWNRETRWLCAVCITGPDTVRNEFPLLHGQEDFVRFMYGARSDKV